MTSDKVTLAILAEKIDNLHDKLDSYKKEQENLEESCRINTEWRLKATGIMTVFTIMGGFIGGLVLWLLDKFSGK